MSYSHYDLISRIGNGPFDRIVALGCGRYESDIAKQILELPCRKLVSVDSFENHIEHVSKLPTKATEHLALTDNVMNVPFASGDTVLLIDIIEHLKREDGEELLDRVAVADKVVIFVPLEPEGFHRRPLDPGNPADEHLSWWTEQDFISRGYHTERIFGCNGEDGFHWDACWAIKP